MSKVNIDSFALGPTIGEGAYGKVLLARKLNTEQFYAIKTMKKAFIAREGKIQFVMNEKNALAVLRHPFIVKLYYTFQDKENLYYVEELCRGSLVQMVNYYRTLNEEKGIQDRCCPEDVIQFYIAEMLNALDYLHTHGHYIHRDLKPENILLNEKGHIKLTDFGTAKFVGDLTPLVTPAEIILEEPFEAARRKLNEKNQQHENVTTQETEAPSEASPSNETSCVDGSQTETKQETDKEQTPHRIRSNTFCGTAGYVSPEVLNDQGAYIYSDVWALGCIIYYMYYGKLLFDGDTDYMTFNMIEEFQSDQLPQNDMSDQLYSLLKIFLSKKEEDRLMCRDDEYPTYEHIYEHPFFTNFSFLSLSTQQPPYVPKLKPLPYIKDSGWDEQDLLETELDSEDELTISPFAQFLLPSEVLIKTSLCNKLCGILYKKRQLLLTSTPRLIYIDPSTMLIRGEIPLSRIIKLGIKGQSKFIIELNGTPTKKYVFEDTEKNANSWIYSIKQYIN